MSRQSKSKSRRQREGGPDFAAQLARSEFGRHYVDPEQVEQTLEDGAVVFRDRLKDRR